MCRRRGELLDEHGKGMWWQSWVSKEISSSSRIALTAEISQSAEKFKQPPWLWGQPLSRGNIWGSHVSHKIIKLISRSLLILRQFLGKCVNGGRKALLHGSWKRPSDQSWLENTSPSLRRSQLYIWQNWHIWIWQVNILRRSSFLYLAHQHISPFSTAKSGVSPLYIAPISFYGWRQEMWKCENYASYLTKDWGYWGIKMVIMVVFRSWQQDGWFG